MRPTLFIIPQLPQTWLVPLVVVTLLIGAMLSWRASRVVVSATSAATSSTRSESSDAFTPFFGALGLCALLFVSSRNPITLHSYGLMLVVGFGVAAWLSCREAERRGINPNIVLDLALPLLFVSVIFCRILYVLLDWNQFRSTWEMIRLWDGGLSFHGSLVAAPLVVWFYARKNGLSFGTLTDCIAPNAFLGYAIGRIGCLLNGCCYGGVCDPNLLWAMRFVDERNRALLTPPSHPAQLYSSLFALTLFFLMQRVKDKPRWNRFSGQLTLLFFALYAVERFVIEIFRQGATASTVFGSSWMTQAQFASILGLIFLGALYIFLSRKSSTRTSLQLPISNL